jgi:hypothetical protein
VIVVRRAIGVSVAAMLAAACSNGAPDSSSAPHPTYDKTTGKLTQLTYDRNHNGKIDTWTDMDGTRPLRSRIDLNEDGKIDRWEYYDEKGQLLKVGFSRRDDGKPDAWAFAGPGGKVERIEISSTGDEHKIDRWEHYDPARIGPNDDTSRALAASEEDTDRDGRPDKWETYENGAIASVAFDEGGTGRPTRRLTYRGGRLVLIESDPDGKGGFRRHTPVK